MKLTPLGINKHELEFSNQTRALFSNGDLVALFIPPTLYAANLSLALPNTIRHTREWAQSLGVPSHKIQTSNNLESLLE
jgi:hypothetical protein